VPKARCFNERFSIRHCGKSLYLFSICDENKDAIFVTIIRCATGVSAQARLCRTPVAQRMLGEKAQFVNWGKD
jgi:hypothetical protein